MVSYLIIPLLVSALASIVVGLAIEQARVPVLEIGEPHEVRVPMFDGDTPVGQATSYRFRVKGRAHGRFLSWFLQRQVARDCRATLRFTSRDGNAVSFQPMPGRWAGSIQPLPISGWIGAQREQVTLYDPTRFEAASRVDIPADTSEELDCAIHFDGDSSAFGWTNDSYLHGGRHPHYLLAFGRYVVEISVHAEGVTVRSLQTLSIGPGAVAPPSQAG